MCPPRHFALARLAALFVVGGCGARQSPTDAARASAPDTEDARPLHDAPATDEAPSQRDAIGAGPLDAASDAVETKPRSDAADVSPKSDAADAPVEVPIAASTDLIERIAFGSCNELTRPQTFWPRIIERQPQVFLFLGDNAYLDYGDTYAQLGALPGFQQLLAVARPFAIWDDHDYGTNDGGAAFAGKDSFKKKFVDFWGPLGAIPADSPRRARAGNYDVAFLGPLGRRVEIVMLDNRYFKGVEPDGTVLGDAQWEWLATALALPADLRIIMSGFAAVGSSTASEGWAEYPAEQQRLYDVIKGAAARGVLIVSGDKHYAEISRRDVGLGYPLYDFTSSSLSASNSYAPQDNIYRDTPAAASQNHNFGLVTIDWSAAGVPFTVDIIDAGTGTLLFGRELSLAALGGRN